MPSSSPLEFEPVSYEVYEQQRDSGLPPTSLHERQAYTVRLKSREPTAEIYAYDCQSQILKIRHLGHYSIVRFAVAQPRLRSETERGINSTGIIFSHQPIPEDIEYIPYKDEVGYFTGSARGSGRHEVSESDEQEEEKEEILDHLGELALTH